MLKKSARLEVSENFKWVLGGSKAESAHLKLFYRMGVNQRTGKSGSSAPVSAKVGVAVNTKDFKKANLRVRAKRACFEAARIVYDNLPVGLNLVIMPKSAVFECSVDELVMELKNAKIFN